MKTYTITEKQNKNSTRDGVEIILNSLTSAKRYATKNQCFQGTFLEISEGGIVVAQKEDGGKWVNR